MRPTQSVMFLAVVRRGREETLALSRALRELDYEGVRVPCADEGIGDWWLSEDAQERRKAAKRCRGCLVLAECGQAAKARKEAFGVWAGRDFTRNPRARKD